MLPNTVSMTIPARRFVRPGHLGHVFDGRRFSRRRWSWVHGSPEGHRAVATGRGGCHPATPVATRRRPGTEARAAATPATGAPPRSGRAGPQTRESLATVLVVERGSEPHGRFLALRPAARHHPRPPVLPPPTSGSSTSAFVGQALGGVRALAFCAGSPSRSGPGCFVGDQVLLVGAPMLLVAAALLACAIVRLAGGTD